MAEPVPGASGPVDVLVTGAAGRIGRVVAPGLVAAGLSVRLTDIAPVPPELSAADYIQADMVDGDAMVRACRGVSTLVHLAGMPGVRDWPILERVNIAGTRTVFEAAITAGVRHIVYASTNHVCGFNPADVRLSPDTPLFPDSAYGVTKLYGEQLLTQLCCRHDTSGTSLRIGSFLPEPTQARHLKTWLSYGDTVRLIVAAVASPKPGHRIVWGMSGNRRANVDAGHWAAINYLPQDDAETYLPALLQAGVNPDEPEWPFLGANLAVVECD